MERAEREGREPDEELRGVVGRVVLSGMVQGYAMGEGMEVDEGGEVDGGDGGRRRGGDESEQGGAKRSRMDG